MKKVFILFGLFILLILWSCSDKKNNFFNAKDYFDIKDLSPMAITEFFSVVSHTKLEVTDESIIRDIEELKVADNKEIWISSYRDTKVLQFDSNGKFLKSWIKVGQGPGEIPRNSDFTFVPRKNGNLLVYSSYRVLEFAPNGNLLRHVKKDSSKSFAPHSLIEHNGNFWGNINRIDSLQNQPVMAYFNNSLTNTKFIFPVIELPHPKSTINFFSSIGVVGEDIYFVSPGIKILFKLNSNDLILNEIYFPDRKSMNLNWSKLEHKKWSLFSNLVPIATNYIFLYECLNEERYILILNTITKKGIRFKINWGDFSKGALISNRFFATQEGYLGTIIFYPDDFNSHKNKNSKLSNIEFSDNDNPVLIFLKVKKERLP